MDWTDEVIASLKSLWDQGHSTAEIGRRLNVSKNAIVGKAHRLSLPSRPSPIRRNPHGAATPMMPRRASTAQTTPDQRQTAPAALEPAPLSRLQDIRVKPELPSGGLPRPEPVRSTVAPNPVPAPSLRGMPAARRQVFTACCWPIGEPGTRSFRFCDAQAMASKPYCEAHAQLAYVKVRDRREDAA